MAHDTSLFLQEQRKQHHGAQVSHLAILQKENATWRLVYMQNSYPLAHASKGPMPGSEPVYPKQLDPNVASYGSRSHTRDILPSSPQLLNVSNGQVNQEPSEMTVLTKLLARALWTHHYTPATGSQMK